MAPSEVRGARGVRHSGAGVGVPVRGTARVEPGGIDEPHLGGLVVYGDLPTDDLAEKVMLNS